MKLKAPFRIFKKICIVGFVLVAVTGYWIERKTAESEVEVKWREYLWTLANDEPESAYTFIAQTADFNTFDKFSESFWLDGTHLWSLSVSNAPLQIVSVCPNFFLNSCRLRSSTGIAKCWWSKPSGIYTEVKFVKTKDGWRLTGLPMAVAH